MGKNEGVSVQVSASRRINLKKDYKKGEAKGHPQIFNINSLPL
jgi:hypothetical protein